MSIRREFIVHQSSRGRSHPEPICWSARDHYAVADYDLRHLPTAEVEKSGRHVPTPRSLHRDFDPVEAPTPEHVGHERAEPD